MAKISCGLTIDMLAPYIEDTVFDNPKIEVEGGIPITQVYRQALMDVSDLIDDFRGTLQNVARGNSDFTNLITLEIPALVNFMHSIKSDIEFNEEFENGSRSGAKVYREKMQEAIELLVQEWDAEAKTTGTSGTSAKEATTLSQTEMPDGDAPVGNEDVSDIMSRPITASVGYTNIGKSSHRSMDKIISEALGDELIERAPDLVDTLKDVVSHSVADTRVDGNSIRFTMEKRKIRTSIKDKLREAVSMFYNTHAIAAGNANPIGNVSGDVLFLTREQLPSDIRETLVEENFSVYTSRNIIDSNGKRVMLLVGDQTAAIKTLDIQNVTPVSELNLALDRETVKSDMTEPVINAYLADVILGNFDSMIKNMIPFLYEGYKESFRKGSVEIIDGISGNQAKAITRANITTTPKLMLPVKGNLNDTVNILERSIRNRGTKTVKEVINDSGIVDTLIGDRPLMRIRLADGSFEDVVLLKINNARYPIKFNRSSKEWDIVFEVNTNAVVSGGIDDGIIDEAPLLNMMNEIFKIDGIKEAKNIFGLPTEVNVGSVAVALTSIADSLIDSKNGLELLDVSTNSHNKFLTEEEVESLSSVFIDLPQDISEAGKVLKLKMNNTHGAESEILRGLYYRFFNPKEYYITRKNPITGKKETQKHNSFYRISKLGLGKESVYAKDQLIALKSMLNTIAPNEFINLVNGTAILSNTLGGDTIKNNFDSIDFYNTVPNGSTLVTRDSAFRKFKITKIPKTSDVILVFNPGVNQKEITLSLNDSSFGGASFTKFPFEVKDDSGFSLKDYENMLRSLGLPTKFATQEFLSLTEGSITNSDMKNFISSVVGVKLANGSGILYRKSGASELGINLTPSSSTFVSPKYNINANLPKDFKESLGKVLDKYEGLSVRKFVSDHEKNRRMTTATVNKALRIKQVLREAELAGSSNIYRNSLLATGKLTIESTYSKNGIIEGLEGKSNSGMSSKEQFKFLVEGAFLSIAEQKNFTQAVFQPSTKSDRKTVGTVLIGRSGDSSYLPKTENGTLDRDLLLKDVIESQDNFYSAVEETIINEWVGTGTKYGNGLLSRLYKAELKIKNSQGDDVLITKEILDKAKKSLRDLYEVLNDLKLDFKQVREFGGIISNMGVDKKAGFASIRYSTLRMVEIMQDKTLASEFIEMNRLMFERSANKLFGNSYSPSQEALDIIERRFGEMSYKEAKKTIIDSFFYNDILISNEIQRFETGPIEQFKTKEPSILEPVYGKKSSEILAHIKELVGGRSFEELAGNTRLGFAKKVIENPILTAKHKVKLLEFDDIATQLSPAYVDQVKRNQGVGTSLQMFTKAGKTEGGALVGEFTKCATIDDPSFELEILGTSGMSEVDTYDATLIMHPIEMIKYNNSLGNTMSNFSSKGGAFKDANVSSSPEGYYIYQKKASQPLFSTEFLINATPEHATLIRKLNTQIKFGEALLYVENHNNETVEDGAQQITYDRLLQYGESLGKLKTSEGAIIDAEALLFKALNKELTEDEINELSLVTDKVLKRFDNIQELWDHFGGLEGDYNRLLTKDNERELFPFGYGWYKASEVISNYRGVDGNYPIRDAYIGKVGFSSQEKAGSRSVNPASSLTDNSEFQFEEVPNSDSGIILQPDHDPDTTASMSNKKEGNHDSDIKVITQILSAAVGEGEGFENVKEILDTVGAVVDMEMDEFEAEISEFGEKYRNNITDRDVSDEEAKQAGYLSIAYNLTKASLQTRVDPGVTGSMLFDSEPNEVNFDHKAILPVLRTAVNSELNKRTVNLRFKGNQTVVTASHDQIKTYSFGPTDGLYRSTINKLADEYLSQGLELPIGWEMSPINQLDNLVDTDYVYEILEDGSRIRTTFGKFRRMKDVQGSNYKSVFSPINTGIKSGNILRWLNYRSADNTQNLKDTAEYKRYVSAVDFYTAAKINLGAALTNYPEYAGTSYNLEALNRTEFVKEVSKSLHNVLQEPGKWVTDEAEFYVPPMHQAAFLIDDFDTLHDIIGTAEQPDTKALINVGLITTREAEILDRRFSSSEAQETVARLKDEAPNPFVDKYLEAKRAQIEAMESYFGGTTDSEGKVELQLSGLRKLLKQKAVGKTTQAQDKQVEATLKNHPILGLLQGTGTKERALKRIETILQTNNKISKIQLSLLSDLRSELTLTNTAEEVSTLINTAITKYKQFWVQTLVDNFPYTLTFISARIPASGKQSYVAAKVKNFVFTTRNASYGPLELIGISGADYDIDKQNNLTWDVDIYGKVYDWLDYEDADGKLLPTKVIKNAIESEVAEYEASLVGTGLAEQQVRTAVATYRKTKIDEMSRRLQNRVVKGLMTNILDPKNAIEAATAVAMSKLKGIKRKLAEFDYGRIDETYILQRAFRNDPEINELVNALDPENISTDIKNIKKAISQDQMEKYADSVLQVLLEERKHALPFSSMTKMMYERVNLDGKTGIGIFASALKGYFASYYAWIGNKGLIEYRSIVDSMRDSGELMKFPSMGEANDEVLRRLSDSGKKELDRLKFSSPYVKYNDKGKIDSRTSVLKKNDIEVLGDDLNLDALQVVSQDDNGVFRLKNITTLANTGKWSVEGYSATQRAREAAELVRSTNDAEAQSDIISKFIVDIKLFEESNVSSQAWADLSELLNAATDNAKELILGYIGATDNTDAIIAAMVVMGVDLNTALTLLNDPQVKRVIKKLEDSDYLFGARSSDFIQTVGKAMESAAKRYRVDTDAIAEANPDMDAEELDKQAVLAKLYNPARQIATFSKIGEELTALSSSFLSINQGLPNSEYDVFNFIRKANKALKNGTFKDFVGNPERREEMIDLYEKTGLNVPYIIANNPHYFGQFRALNLTNDIINSVSFISGLVRSDLLNHEGKRVDTLEFKSHTDNVYGLIVDSYYNDPRTDNVKISIDDKAFDLSKDSQIGDIGGRLEFVELVPDLVGELQNDQAFINNTFVKKLFINVASQDKETGDQATYVHGPATGALTPEEISILRANANKLKAENPEIYNVLFNYSLIVDRGGLSKGSLAQFFTSEDFEPFNNYVKTGDVERKLTTAFASMMPEARQLLTPSLINTASSDAAYFASKAKQVSEEGLEEGLEVGNERRLRFERLNHRHEVGWLNKKRAARARTAEKDPETIPYPNVIRIAETGTVMAWNETLNTYLPITKAKPDVSIPVSIDGVMSNNQVFDITRFGFNYGWEVKIESEFKGGKTGRILRKTSGKRGMYDVLVDGTIKQFSSTELKNFNVGIVLKGNKIDISRVGRAEERVIYYNPTTNVIALNSKGGNYLPVEADANLEYLYDSTDNAVYNPEFARYINLKSGKIDGNFVVENFMEMPVVKNFRKALVTSAYRTENVTEGLLSNEEISTTDNLRAAAVRDRFDDLHLIDVISLMRGGIKSWEAFVKEIVSDSNYTWGISATEFNPKKIPTKTTKAEMSFLTDPKYAASISIGKALELLDKFNITEEDYFDRVLSSKGIDKVAFVKTDGTILNGKRFLPVEVTNPRIPESKDYKMPSSLHEDADKLIGEKTLKRMAKVLNGKFTNTRTTVLNSEEIRATYGDKYADLRGFVLGGQIVLNYDKATLSTPIHELGHIYLAYLKDEDQKLYDYVVSESLKSDIADSIRKVYPELSNSDVGEEVFVELLGIEFGKDLLSVSKSNISWANISRKLSNNKHFGKVVNFFRDLVGWLTGKKVNPGLDISLQDSLLTILNKVGDRIVYGKESIFYDFTQPEKTAMKLADPYGTLTSKQLIDLLVNRGYIRKVCT
jgi:hypothetical protein